MYTAQFFSSLSAGARTSAAEIVPFILRLFPTRRVIDVGCGTGEWLSEFRRCGVIEILGVDGAYTLGAGQRLSAGDFLPHDLDTPLPVQRTFDLALCLEVIEHLTIDRGRLLVKELSTVAPVVLFSAAIPFQTGNHHINEQWPDYWESEFARCGFTAFDCIRPAFWNNSQVEWWYRQNIIIYVRADLASALVWPGDVDQLSTNPLLRLVHPLLFERVVRWIDMTRLPHKFLEGNPRYKDLSSELRAHP